MLRIVSHKLIALFQCFDAKSNPIIIIIQSLQNKFDGDLHKYVI